MTIYSVTTSNWNSPAFWSGINEGAGGHTLNFSALPATYSVIFDATGTTTTISDGTTTFTIGEPGTAGTDANLGGTTLWSFFNEVRGTQGDDSLTGGSGNDTILGGEGNDTIDGGGGDDLLGPGDGFDTVLGGTGNDTLELSSDDFLDGGDGTDVLDATFGSFADTVTFNADNSGDTGANNSTFQNIEEFNSGGGADFYDASAAMGDLRITTGDDNDTILGGFGADTLDGGDGADTLDGGDGADLILGGLGSDSIEGGDGDDQFQSGAGDTVFGQGGDDHFYLRTSEGTGGTVTWYGGETTEANADPTNGSNGDIMRLDFNLGVVTANLTVTYGGDDFGTVSGAMSAVNFFEMEGVLTGEGNDSIDAGASNTGQLINTMGGDDSIRASAGADRIFGGDGNDTINAREGDDTIYAGDGNDLIDDWLGNDLVFAGAGSDTVDLSNGDDTVFMEDGDDVVNVFDNHGDNSLDGGSGTDTVDFRNWQSSVGTNVDIGVGGSSTFSHFFGNTTGSFANFEVVSGTVYNDTLDAADNVIGMTLQGEAGDDRLVGGSGNDTLDGGTGSDTIVLGNAYGGDSITGGEDVGDGDVDVLDASGVTNDGINVNFSGTEAGSITSTEGTANFVEIESFILTDQADTFDGFFSGADMTVEAGAGNDTITGGNLNNSLLGGAGDDLFYIGNGADSIQGGTGIDTLSMGRLDDVIILTFDGDGSGSFTDSDSDSGTFSEIEAVEGSSGNDSIDAAADSSGVSLSGMAGDDTVTGGSGSDTVDGGAGADLLTGGAGADVFVVDGSADTITDFDGITGVGDGDSTNNDFVDLSGFYNPANLAIWNAANPGQTYATPLDWLRADQADGTLGEAGNLVVARAGTPVDPSELTGENTGVICFASGTLIRVPGGEVPVERLRCGDLVQTRDNSVKPILWVGRKELDQAALSAAPNLRPVRLSAGRFGLTRDLILSPQHGVVLRDPNHVGAKVLWRAHHLARTKGGAARVLRNCRHVCYHHILFDQHEVVFSNGLASESFYPGPMAYQSLHFEAQKELTTLFPDLAVLPTATAYGPAAHEYSRTKHLPEHLKALQ